MFLQQKLISCLPWFLILKMLRTLKMEMSQSLSLLIQPVNCSFPEETPHGQNIELDPGNSLSVRCLRKIIIISIIIHDHI